MYELIGTNQINQYFHIFRIFVEGDQNVKQKWLLYVEKAYYSKPYRMNTSKYQHLLYELLNTCSKHIFRRNNTMGGAGWYYVPKVRLRA